MSVDYTLFRVSSEFLEIPSSQKLKEWTAETALPFGSRLDIIERLCSILGFEHDERRDKQILKCWKESQSEGLISSDCQPQITTTVHYKYHQNNNNGRVVTYELEGDPIICIWMNRAYLEDFFPLVEVLSELAPFLVLDPQDGRLTNPEEFFYSLDDWIQKNYEEDVRSFQYEQ